MTARQAKKEAPPLVLVEWVDSAQPVPGWRFLDDLPPLDAVRCRSVGWLIGRDRRALMLAPNLGGLEEGGERQACGFIRIPAAAVTRIATLVEAVA